MTACKPRYYLHPYGSVGGYRPPLDLASAVCAQTLARSLYVHDTPSRHDGAGKTHRSRFWLSAAHCACVSNLATHRGACAASSLKVRSGSNSPKECCDATHHDRRKLNSTTPSRNHALSPGLWCDVRDDIVIAPVYTALAAVAQKSSHGAAALAALAAQEIFDERQGAFTESQHIGVHSTIFIALS